MTNDTFIGKFAVEFPEFDHLLQNYLDQSDASNFVIYIVEFVFNLVDYDVAMTRGFDVVAYSDPIFGNPNLVNKYVFNYLKEHKHLLEFWLL